MHKPYSWRSVPGASPSSGAPPSAFGWQQFLIGGGGIITKLDIANDGTMVAATDSAGAFLYSPNAPNGAGTTGFWQTINDASRFPAAFINNMLASTQPFPPDGNGVYEIRISKSDSRIIYMLFAGWLWKSVNRGTSWTQMLGWNGGVIDTEAQNGNTNYRNNGQYMAIDPVNPNVVIIGTPTSGLSYTINGGDTWTPITTSQVPAPVANTGGIGGNTPYTILFDRGTSSAGNTPGVMIHSWDNGIYYANPYTTASAWTQQSSAVQFIGGYPCSDAIGHLYVPDSAGNLWHKPPAPSATWTDVLPTLTNGLSVYSVCVDTQNDNGSGPGGIFAVNGGTNNVSVYTYGNTTSWTGSDFQPVSLITTEIPWLAAIGPTFGRIASNPSTGDLWMTTGSSAWRVRSPPPTNGTSTVTWEAKGCGIENQTCCFMVHCQPSNNIVVSLEDHPIYAKQSGTNSYPPTYFPSPVDIQGWSLDCHGSALGYMINLSNLGPIDKSGASTDGGQTFGLFPTFAPGFPGDNLNGGPDGNISCGGPSNFVLIRTDNGTATNNVFFTTNGGTTWNAATFNGATPPTTTPPTPWFAHEPFLRSKILCSDKVSANTHYMFAGSSAANGGGIWQSTDGGATWNNKNNTTILLSNIVFQGLLDSVPGHAGHLFLTWGGIAYPTQPLFRSTDGSGAVWTSVTGMLGAIAFGFGKVATGQTYPAIVVIGWYNGVYGIWRSVDNCASFQAYGPDRFPGNIMDGPICVCGDLSIEGRFYVMFSGTGIQEGTF